MKRKNFTKILTTTGLLLIIAAALFTVYNIMEEKKAEKEARAVADKMDEAMKTGEQDKPAGDDGCQLPDYILNPHKEMPVMEIEGHGYIGKLIIPSLGLDIPVMSEWSYPKLKIAPCRYSGSAYLPGFSIAAHNYDSHFGRLSTVKEGDIVEFADAEGNIISYKVSAVSSIEPAAIDQVLDEEIDMTLFTCTLSGMSRVIVQCHKEK